jgi:hypothetical protein
MLHQFSKLFLPQTNYVQLTEKVTLKIILPSTLEMTTFTKIMFHCSVAVIGTQKR